MKKIIQLLMMIMFIGCCHTYAQKNKVSIDDAFTQKYIMNAEYFFEGTTIDAKNYQDKNGKLWTSCKVQIHRVFKGALKIGTIRVIFPGQGIVTDFQTGQKEEVQLTHNISLSIGKTFALICSSSSVILSSNEDVFDNNNTLELENMFKYDLELKLPNQMLIIPPDEHYVGFSTTADFYKYISSISGFKILYSDGSVFKKEKKAFNEYNGPTGINNNGMKERWNKFMQKSKKRQL